MTLYEFNLLNEDTKISYLWKYGNFVENYITNTEKCALYAIDMFFVELELCVKTLDIKKINSFKSGYLLDKYTNFKELP
jgi:hypothetical protein